MAISVLGGGSWGTALADLLARQGHEVTVWLRDARLAEDIRSGHENTRYLKGHTLPRLAHRHHRPGGEPRGRRGGGHRRAHPGDPPGARRGRRGPADAGAAHRRLQGDRERVPDDGGGDPRGRPPRAAPALPLVPLGAELRQGGLRPAAHGGDHRRLLAQDRPGRPGAVLRPLLPQLHHQRRHGRGARRGPEERHRHRLGDRRRAGLRPQRPGGAHHPGAGGRSRGWGSPRAPTR